MAGRPPAELPAGLEATELPADAVEVGRILGAWGVKGWVKVLPHSASPEALFSSRRWYLQPSEKGRTAFSGTALLRIREAKEHSDSIVASIHDIDDRDLAESLKGARIFVPRSSFPTAGEGEYYWIDLLGLDVVNREGVPLGRVADLMATGPQTVLVLEYEQDGKRAERMIPFVAAYVDDVDLAASKIVVDWQPDY
jgi:16S rRNA processing protein RimM